MDVEQPGRRVRQRGNLFRREELVQVVHEDGRSPVGVVLAGELHIVGGVLGQPSVDHGLRQHHPDHEVVVPNRGSLLVRSRESAHHSLICCRVIVFSG